jgi:hypothetical protein
VVKKLARRYPPTYLVGGLINPMLALITMLVRFKDVSAIFCSPFQKWLEVGHGIRNLKSTPPPAVPVPVPRFPGAGPQLVGSPTNQRLPRSLRRVWALWLGRWHEAGNGQLELRFLKVCQAYDMYVYVCMFMCVYIYVYRYVYIYISQFCRFLGDVMGYVGI